MNIHPRGVASAESNMRACDTVPRYVQLLGMGKPVSIRRQVGPDNGCLPGHEQVDEMERRHVRK